MKITRRIIGGLLLGSGACLIAGPAAVRVAGKSLLSDRHPSQPPPAATGLRSTPAQGQDQAPTRRDFTLVANSYRFSPNRLEVTQDDLVKLTVHSEDVAYSLTIDAYRISKRVPAGGEVTFEFRADRPGTFPFYSNLTSDTRHRGMRGELVVRGK